MKYLIIIEKGDTSFGAYVPDLPGCVAVADTEAEVMDLIHEAIEFHLEGHREEGPTIPRPLLSKLGFIVVAVSELVSFDYLIVAPKGGNSDRLS